MDINVAYLLIGGNMGNTEAYLAACRSQIETRCGHIIKASSVYQTAAWGLENQSAFLNQALQIGTYLSPVGLLQSILEIEESMGRKREIKYGPRLIDIDIILYNHDVISAEGLTVPHMQMQNRRFVLAPLAEIAPGEMHPILKKTILQLLEECPDELSVQKIT